MDETASSARLRGVTASCQLWVLTVPAFAGYGRRRLLPTRFLRPVYEVIATLTEGSRTPSQRRRESVALFPLSSKIRFCHRHTFRHQQKESEGGLGLVSAH